MTMNASGQGPGATAFADAYGTSLPDQTGLCQIGFEDTYCAAASVATGRGAGVAGTWSSTPHGSTCASWTSNGGNYRFGLLRDSNGTANWSQNNANCTNGYPITLLCFVDP
jgi:hypothetical protein